MSHNHNNMQAVDANEGQLVSVTFEKQKLLRKWRCWLTAACDNLPIGSTPQSRSRPQRSCELKVRLPCNQALTCLRRVPLTTHFIDDTMFSDRLLLSARQL
jgi:hypothetical protein